MNPESGVRVPLSELEALYHQLNTDSDLADRVSRPDLYALLRARLGVILAANGSGYVNADAALRYREAVDAERAGLEWRGILGAVALHLRPGDHFGAGGAPGDVGLLCQHRGSDARGRQHAFVINGGWEFSFDAGSGIGTTDAGPVYLTYTDKLPGRLLSRDYGHAIQFMQQQLAAVPASDVIDSEVATAHRGSQRA